MNLPCVPFFSSLQEDTHNTGFCLYLEDARLKQIVWSKRFGIVNDKHDHIKRT